MSARSTILSALAALCFLAGLGAWYAAFRSPKRQQPPASANPLEERFSTQVRPFLDRYCVGCHGSEKPEALLDLTRDLAAARQWEPVLERLEAQEMPPEDAPRQPEPQE